MFALESCARACLLLDVVDGWYGHVSCVFLPVQCVRAFLLTCYNIGSKHKREAGSSPYRCSSPWQSITNQLHHLPS